MTENKAIEQIKRMACNDRCIKSLCNDGCMYGDEMCAFAMAIQALEEIQHYRAIGMTPNQIYVHIGGYVAELSKYAEIGTVEECREAVERMKPKKVLYRKQH